jgi:hypothetical protein
MLHIICCTLSAARCPLHFARCTVAARSQWKKAEAEKADAATAGVQVATKATEEERVKNADAEKAEARTADEAKRQHEAAAVAVRLVYASACDRFMIDMNASQFDSPCATCKFAKKDHQATQPKSNPLPKPPPATAPAKRAVQIPLPSEGLAKENAVHIVHLRCLTGSQKSERVARICGSINMCTRVLRSFAQGARTVLRVPPSSPSLLRQ